MRTANREIACIKRARALADKKVVWAGIVAAIAFLGGFAIHFKYDMAPIFSWLPGAALALIAVAYGLGIEWAMESLPPDTEVILELLTEEEKPKA